MWCFIATGHQRLQKSNHHHYYHDDQLSHSKKRKKRKKLTINLDPISLQKTELISKYSVYNHCLKHQGFTNVDSLMKSMPMYVRTPVFLFRMCHENFVHDGLRHNDYN